MSNFMRRTKNPITDKFETVQWIDNYYGSHRYGIAFSTGTVEEHPGGKLTKWENDTDYPMETDPVYRKLFGLDKKEENNGI